MFLFIKLLTTSSLQDGSVAIPEPARYRSTADGEVERMQVSFLQMTPLVAAADVIIIGRPTLGLHPTEDVKTSDERKETRRNVQGTCKHYELIGTALVGSLYVARRSVWAFCRP